MDQSPSVLAARGIMAAVGLTVLIGMFRRQLSAKRHPDEYTTPAQRTQLRTDRRVLATTALTLAFAASVPVAGFLRAPSWVVVGLVVATVVGLASLILGAVFWPR